jgi:hypothetical protein
MVREGDERKKAATHRVNEMGKRENDKKKVNLTVGLHG